jgi:ATP-dependent Clp protease ATP-binding subunit ClpB
LIEGLSSEGKISEETRERVMNEMRRVFKPEFLNRIDDIVLFKPLQRNEIFKIIDLQIKEIEKRLQDREISVEVTDNAKELVLQKSYSIQYGARPVKRFLQKELETRISRLIIKGELKDGDNIVIDTIDEELEVKIL